MSDTLQHARNREFSLDAQDYGDNPVADRETDLYRGEYVKSFVEKWDELIDWDARAESEGRFFMDVLRARGKKTVLDVACGTGFHSVRLLEAGFDVTSADGSATMLARAFDNAKARGLILKTVQADWRWLNRDIQGKYDAIICLGNSFTHLHEEKDRRRALAEFYAALKHDGVLILDQRNYDAILDQGFSTKHKFYYCGDDVTAEPEHVDDGLVRFKYSFPDGSVFNLNLCPIRKNYMQRLLREAGFERVRTYGDFQATYQENEPDFFVHIVEKSAAEPTAWSDGEMTRAADGAQHDARRAAETYYDSDDAHAFYTAVWGGEDVHVGLYDDTDDIRAASVKTVDAMAELAGPLSETTRILDIGAGYGGSARRLARAHGCSVVCLNIADAQNDVNRHKTHEAGLADKIRVVHGVFEAIPEPDASFDVVWCQDSLLHSDDREGALKEVFRVLKPGGVFVFTDPMQAEDADPAGLTAVYERIGLNGLASFGFYDRAGRAIGFEVLDQIERTGDLRTHYARVREDLRDKYDSLKDEASQSYLDGMIAGLGEWVKAADAGRLAWGIQRLRKPA